MLLEEKRKISEVFEFDFDLYPKSETRKSRKVFFYFKFWQYCNLRCKNDKKLTEAKTYRSSYASRRKIENFRGFRVFEFNLYPISKTRKSRTVSFYFKFWQSLQKQQKNKWGKIFLRYAFSRKKKNSRGFRVFDFDLYPKSKTRKSGKVFFYFNFWQ